jgi:rhodanese-related sulfurtransferase
MNINTKILGIILVTSFGLLILLTSQIEKNQFKYTGETMIKRIKYRDYTLDTIELSKMKDYQVVDLREPQEFYNAYVDTVKNIPFAALLDEEYESFWSSKQPKILIGISDMDLHQAWMLLTQMGYFELYVLETKSRSK